MTEALRYPDNPVLARVVRGQAVESQHRGAWALVDSAGRVLDGAGEWARPIYARSSIKSLQALPLIESGAAERFALTSAEIALACASHSAEPRHTERVAAWLERVGLDSGALQCGPQPPLDPEARAQLERQGREPQALHNNCSGKHAGFLTLALHLGDDPARYLEVESATQRQVRAAVAGASGVPAEELSFAVDGCSAPTWRLPLAALATAIARVANPDGFEAARRAACRRITAAVADHPDLIAGTRRRFCTDLARASRGRLFPKVGAEAVYVVGALGRDRGLAIKLDDGYARGLYAVVLALCRRFELLDAAGLEAMGEWSGGVIRNWAGREVGRIEVAA